MAFQCPTCRADAFTARQKTWASSFLPLKCPSCGGLAAPSWWSALIAISLPFILMFGVWLALDQQAWWPIVAAVVIVPLLLYVDVRHLPLARISPREVTVHRMLGVLAVTFLVVSAGLTVLGYRVVL